MPDDAVHIVQACSETDIAHVRALMREFVAWLRDRYRDRAWHIDTYYDEAAWEHELATLPGDFAPPDGRLLLALHGDAAAGCVGFKRLDDRACDVKRLYVRTGHRGAGIGGALMRRLIAEAHGAGYATMKLDTGDMQPEAIALYRALGFRDTDAYLDLPKALDGLMMFMALDL